MLNSSVQTETLINHGINIKRMISFKTYLIFMLLLGGCISNERSMGNPATEYCINHGGTVKNVQTAEGVAGVCILKNGTECDEWKYFRGEC
jgi:putative hemolysin